MTDIEPTPGTTRDRIVQLERELAEERRENKLLRAVIATCEQLMRGLGDEPR